MLAAANGRALLATSRAPGMRQGRASPSISSFTRLPLVDPRSSFEVAAAHLFRHLHEPRHLKKNPLVQRFFRDRAERTFFPCARAGSARANPRRRPRSRAIVPQAEEAACEHERALRQHTIVTLNLLERRPLTEVARTLGISTRQSYRERTEVLRPPRSAHSGRRRDARDGGRPRRVGFSPAQCRVSRAAGRCRRSVARIRQLAANAPPRQRIAALCESASISAWSAQLGAATRSLSTARKVLASAGALDDARATAGAAGKHRPGRSATRSFVGALLRSPGNFQRSAVAVGAVRVGPTTT